jgi:spore cortex formation protein SpoVR/YcgB (stage V sporulation)
MDYDQLSKGYTWGLQKIYEMVINTDPSYAYLMKSNNLVDQKTVMAHVYGHVDFFKNNTWFSKTNRKMLDTMANHAVRIRDFMDRYGHDVVENFIDDCLAIENLIDPHLPFTQPKSQRDAETAESEAARDPGRTSKNAFECALQRGWYGKKSGDPCRLCHGVAPFMQPHPHFKPMTPRNQ